MKQIISILLVVCSFSMETFAQCNPYYNLKEGSQWELTSYNAKDKVTGRQVNKIVSFEETSSGWEAVMHFKNYDKKDKLVMENEDVKMSCENGKLILDMERFVSAELMESFQDMNMEFDIDNIELPAELAVGTSLDDGSITMSGDMPMTLRVDVTNRKVEAKETITTPAGNYECFKISYDVNTKMVMNIQGSGVEWVAQDVGVVRTETYNKNGKLLGYSLLTNYQK